MKKTYLPLRFIALLFPLIASANVKEYSPPKEARIASRHIQESTLRAHTKFLSSDLLEGRAPASKGDLLTQEYIATQYRLLGLDPLGDHGTYFQTFDLVGVETKILSPLTFSNKSQKRILKNGSEFVAISGKQSSQSSLSDVPVIFVGYGIVAPEYGWDDYKGTDVRGKVLLMLNNDPAHDPNLFAGERRLYYGRWDYKYEIAAKLGAAGAMIIHTTPSAGYGWNVVETGWSGEQFELPSEGEPTVEAKGWMTEEVTKKVFSMAGKDLDALIKTAQTKDFQPVSLDLRVSLRSKNVVRSVKTSNVIGGLKGSDKELSKEVVLYTAHHDHLGIKANAKPGEDAIYNGAIDNASGVAGMLAIAKAFTSLPKPPKRSIVFAAVGAEEQGLLGSAYLARYPVVQPGRIATNINMDGVSILGKAKDITSIGKGKSSLDEKIEAIAKMQGRIVKADQFPDKGYFYRSDHFNFAKIGVPSAYFHEGIDIMGKSEMWGREESEKWTTHFYHQPSDEYDPNWNLEGALQDLELNFYLGYEVAQDRNMPSWNPGDEFEAARKEALKKIH